MKGNSCDKRKWLVYIASCLVSMLDFGLVLTFGSIFVILLDTFGENRTSTAAVQSILLGTTTMASVVAGILIRRFGVARVTFSGSVLISGGFIFSFFANSILLLDIFIGAIAGTGISFAYVSSMVMARNSFEGNARDLAVSAHNVFVGIGCIIYPYLLKYLAKTYAVNGTFLILGGVLLNNFVISLLLVSREYNNSLKSESPDISIDSINRHTESSETPEINVVTSKTQAKTDETNSVIKDKHKKDYLRSLWMRIRTIMNLRYTLVLLGAAAVMPTNSCYLVVFDDINVWKGFSDDQSALLFTLFSGANTFGRALPLICSKIKPGTDLLLLLTFFAITGCVAQLCILLTTELHFAIIGNMLSGMIHGGVMSATAVVVAKYSSKELFSVAFGILLTVIGILVLSLGPVYGYIRDSIKSYEAALILTGAVQAAGALPFIMAKAYNIYQSRREQENAAKSLQGEILQTPRGTYGTCS